jgi:hypothetical protein
MIMKMTLGVAEEADSLQVGGDVGGGGRDEETAQLRLLGGYQDMPWQEAQLAGATRFLAALGDEDAA